MRTLGLDIGSKRIGLAISDETGSIAFPEGKLERSGRKRDLEALRELIVERGVERVVVGLPRHMDGREGKGADAARALAQDLATLTGLAVDLIDERLTTVEAERILRETGRRGAKRKAVVDAVAASIILRTYLDQQRIAKERLDAAGPAEPEGEED
jgi:putative Holliday junction resolvase